MQNRNGCGNIKGIESFLKVFLTMNKVLYLSLCLTLLMSCGPGPVANNNNNTNSVNVNISESFISDAVKKALEKERNNPGQSKLDTPAVNPPSAPKTNVSDDVELELQAATASDRDAFSTIIAFTTAINDRDYESFVDVFHPDFPWGSSSPELSFDAIEENNLYQELIKIQVSERSQDGLVVYVERLVSNDFGLVYELTNYQMKQVGTSWKIYNVILLQQVPA